MRCLLALMLAGFLAACSAQDAGRMFYEGAKKWCTDGGARNCDAPN